MDWSQFDPGAARQRFLEIDDMVEQIDDLRVSGLDQRRTREHIGCVMATSREWIGGDSLHTPKSKVRFRYVKSVTRV